MATKAQLSKQMKKLGIPIPSSSKVADMEHRLKYWKGGPGFLVRLLRTPSSKFEGHPIKLLNDRTKLYWIPNSEMATTMVESKILLVLDRTEKPSNNAVVIDVPSNYDSGRNNGGNDGADS